MNTESGFIVLVVDDSPDEILLTRLAIKKAQLASRFFSVQDGREAVQYLTGEGPYSDRNAFPLPQLLLLDLNMPVLDGFGVLSWLQGKPEFNDIITIVLSSSDFESDILRAKSLGADDYLVKPFSHSDRIDMMLSLKARWLCDDENAAEEPSRPFDYVHLKNLIADSQKTRQQSQVLAVVYNKLLSRRAALASIKTTTSFSAQGQGRWAQLRRKP